MGMNRMTQNLPASIDDTVTLLRSTGYIAGRDLATVAFLALKMGRPLFLEGEAGVGKTEIAKVLAETLGRRLIRLQCYEGLDINSAVYEWNYSAQMIEIRLAEASGELDRERLGQDIFAEKFLIKRALLQALEAPKGQAPGLLIEMDLGRGGELASRRPGSHVLQPHPAVLKDHLARHVVHCQVHGRHLRPRRPRGRGPRRWP